MTTQQDLKRARLQVTHRFISSGQAVVRSLTIPGGSSGAVLTNMGNGNAEWVNDGVSQEVLVLTTTT